MKTAEASLFSVLCEHKDEDSSSDDESEDLGDVLDSEVSYYLASGFLNSCMCLCGVLTCSFSQIIGELLPKH